jgi:hypothetical protein
MWHDLARPRRVKIPDKPARDKGAYRTICAGFPGTRVEGLVGGIVNGNSLPPPHAASQPSSASTMPSMGRKPLVTMA